MAKKVLDELLANMNDIQLEEIEILTSPLRALKDGVMFIPTLKYGEEQISGILLKRDKIEEFLTKVRKP